MSSSILVISFISTYRLFLCGERNRTGGREPTPPKLQNAEEVVGRDNLECRRAETAHRSPQEQCDQNVTVRVRDILNWKA